MSDKKEEKSFFELVGWLVCFVPIVACSWALTAYTGMCLWNWFIAAHFGIKTIGLIQSIALMLVCHFFTGMWKIEHKHFNDEKTPIGNHLAMMAAMGLMLGTAYILRMWL